MRVCSFCGESNEDWMNICQRCGNSIVNADVKENEKRQEPYEINEVKYTSKKHNKKENKFIETETEESEEPKKKLIIENLDLKIILAVLLVILFVLIIYTISTF